MKRPYRRRQYIVDWRYQGKFVLTIAGICAMGTLVALSMFNTLAYRKLDAFTWRMHIEAGTVGELIRPYLIYSYVLALFITIAVLVGFTRFVMLKTAPPLFRLQRFIERAGDGNLSAGLDWVEHDEFRETAHALDRMVEVLRGRFARVKRASEDVVDVSIVLAHDVDRPQVAAEKCRAMADRLKALRKELATPGNP